MKSATTDAPSRLLPRALFLLNFFLAAVLTFLVFLAPVLAGWDSRLLNLFAQDATLRRTALASAIGLVVTAWVFFRPPAGAAAVAKTPRLPPNNVVGA